jgi:hypothetical protein
VWRGVKTEDGKTKLYEEAEARKDTGRRGSIKIKVELTWTSKTTSTVSVVNGGHDDHDSEAAPYMSINALHASRVHFTTRLFVCHDHLNDRLNEHGYIHSTRTAQSL